MTSKIKVDNIADQDDNNIINESGDVITVGASGDTVAIAGNIIKSNAYQASDGGNIASQSGTTITLFPLNLAYPFFFPIIPKILIFFFLA